MVTEPEKGKKDKQRFPLYKRFLVILVIAGLLLGIACGKLPQTADYWLTLGNKHLLDFDTEQAIVAFLKAIEIDPLNIPARLGLARIYKGMGDFEKAITYLNEILVLDPQHGEALKLLQMLDRHDLTDGRGDEPPSGQPAEGQAIREAHQFAFAEQRLGANPVYYYQHPRLDWAIDLREEDADAARRFYVETTHSGFVITSRDTLREEYLLLHEYPKNKGWKGPAVWVIQVTEEEYQLISSSDNQIVRDGHSYQAEFLDIEKGWLCVFDNLESDWIRGRDSFVSSGIIDRVFVGKLLCESPQPGIWIETAPVNAAREWEEFTQLLETDPLAVERYYGLPTFSLSDEISSKWGDINHFQRLNLLGPRHPVDSSFDMIPIDNGPFYTHTSMDFNGDGILEHLLACTTYSQDDSGFPLDFNYWAVFTETEGGLRLTNLFGPGGGILWSQGSWHQMTSFPWSGHSYIFLETQPFENPLEEISILRLYFWHIIDSFDRESGLDLQDFSHYSFVPASRQYDWGDDFNVFLVDRREYEESLPLIRDILDGAQSFSTVMRVKGNDPEQVIGSGIDSYVPDWDRAVMDSYFYSFLPLREEDWKSAVTVASFLAKDANPDWNSISRLFPDY